MKVSIIGAAGCAGSSASFNIATRGLAEEMVLVDIRQNVLENHYLDIISATVACQKDISIRIGRYEDTAGSDIVIIAAGVSVAAKASASGGSPAAAKPVNSRQQLLTDNLAIIQEVAQGVNRFCPGAIVITVTNPVEALTYASYLLSSTRERKKFIGYTLNDSIRLRQWVAEAVGVEPSRVQGIVMGEHGDSQVPVFSSVRVDNKPISLSEEIKRELRQKPAEHIRHLLSLKAGRSSGWLCGVGLADMVKVISDDTGEVIPCAAVVDGEYGYRGFSMGVPAVLGRPGIREILQVALLPEEKAGLEKSVSIIKEAARFVEKALRPGKAPK